MYWRSSWQTRQPVGGAGSGGYWPPQVLQTQESGGRLSGSEDVEVAEVDAGGGGALVDVVEGRRARVLDVDLDGADQVSVEPRLDLAPLDRQDQPVDGVQLHLRAVVEPRDGYVATDLLRDPDVACRADVEEDAIARRAARR